LITQIVIARLEQEAMSRQQGWTHDTDLLGDEGFVSDAAKSSAAMNFHQAA
jgi:hypothetical protein